MKLLFASPLASLACAAPLLAASAGCASAGYPARGAAAALPRMIPTAAPTAAVEADLIVIREKGACTAMASSRWLGAARGHIAAGVRTAYANLPIDHEALSADVGDALLSEEAICAATTRASGATRGNHAELRERYQSSALSQEEAHARGIAARLFSPRTRCDAKSDWSRIPGYIGVSGCDEVASKLQSMGIPFTLFALEIDLASAQAYLQSPAVAPFFMRYTNSGPVSCGGDDGYRDAYHSLYVSPVWSALTYVERSRWSEGLSSCSLLPGCTGGNGERYESNDLLFGFGLRLYLQAEVEIDGERKRLTLIMGSTAAASGSWLAGLLPKKLPYERFLGSEVVKKIILESAANGW